MTRVYAREIISHPNGKEERCPRKSLPSRRCRPVFHADYCSSEGKNSLAPMDVVIRTLRTRIGKSRPIMVCHVDQSENDFNSLFEVLAADPDRYTQADP